MRNPDRPSWTRKLTLWAVTASAVVLVTAPLWACSVPVFRYALEKWRADAYEAIVFHRGPLTGDALAAVAKLSPEGLAGEVSANVRVHTVDLDAGPDAALIELWQEHGSPEGPHLVLRYPATVRNPATAWSVPLTASHAEAVVDSPVRREIARRLLKGETAVWVLLEGADAAQNDETFQTLSEELEQLESTLKLPEISAEDVAQGLVSVDPTELRLDFSILRLPRDNPEEQPLVHMLLGSEPDLQEYAESMAFPVFGRGRALYALVGAGINREMIAQAGADLTGPCTCTIKEQNPGTDLLLAVDWDSLVAPDDAGHALPPLVAVSTSLQPAEPKILAIPPGRKGNPTESAVDAAADATNSDPEAEPKQPADIEVAAATTAESQPARITSSAGSVDPPVEESIATSSFLMPAIIVAGLVVLAALMGAARLLFHKQESSR